MSDGAVMTWPVFAALMTAALLHAGWNSLIRSVEDRLRALTMLAGVSGLAALVLVPFFPLPRLEAWPWVILSGLLHIAYLHFLGRAYRIGELAEVYPISRGTAPILSGILAFLFLGQGMDAVAVGGVAVLVAGIVLLSLKGSRDFSRIHGRVLTYGLIVSAMTAAYTLADAIGARVNEDAHSYALWMFVSYGLAMPLIAVVREGRGALPPLLAHWKSGVVAGLLSFAAYWLVIWCMTKAPVGIVAALRETSVLFAAVISAVFLREPLTRFRVVSALLIVAGVVLLKLG